MKYFSLNLNLLIKGDPIFALPDSSKALNGWPDYVDWPEVPTLKFLRMLQRQEVAGVAARARRSRARASAREARRGPAVILQREHL